MEAEAVAVAYPASTAKRPADGEPDGARDAKKLQETEIQAYFDQHQVGPLVEDMLWAVAKAKPVDPVAFMAAHLAGKATG